MTTLAATRPRPVWSGSFPDPFVIRRDAGWTAYGTGVADDGRVFPTLHSADGHRWYPGGGALLRPEGGSTDFWAPEVCYRDGQYAMVYSRGVEDRGHELRVAFADRPEGPFRESPRPILEGCPFAIDASPFFHEGRWLLFYARDLFDGDRPGTALVVVPWDDPERIGTDFHVVARATRDWQRYERDRRIHGGIHDWHTLEGPNAVPPARPGGPIRLLYSGGNWTNDSYGVDWLLAEDPFGTWRDEGSDRPRLLSTSGELIGPGHCAAYDGPEGRMLAYHAWDPERTARRMLTAPLLDSGTGFVPIA